MNPVLSNAIIQKYKLIPSEISRKVLWAILYNVPIHAAEITYYVNEKQLKQIRDRYQLKKEGRLKKVGEPRNIIFYEMIRDIYPDYQWQIKERHVIFSIPKAGKMMEPSLLSLLLHLVDEKAEDSKLIYHYKNSFNEINQQALGSIEALFEKLHVIKPTENEMNAFLNWFKKGLKGEPLNVFSLACPDYSTELTGNALYPHRHTFESVGEGIGLVAKRIFDAHSDLSTFFKKNQITFSQSLAMADYEILSETTRNKLKIDENTFLKKLEKSVDAFQKENTFIHSFMLSKLCENLNEWKKLYADYRERFEKKDFGLSKLTPSMLESIAQTRKDFYSRWFGAQPTFGHYISILLDQGAEYAVVGNLVTKKYENVLILGADSILLSHFYHIDQQVPLVYLKPFYK